jgi:glyoxylase-like metal-dependent hydrolase (beta-lactamase superfamily II)
VPAERLTVHLSRLLLGRFQAYLWRDDDGVTLIDTGAADTGGALAAALDEVGIAPPDVDRVVLTHFHDDHAGAAAEVRAWGNVQVAAHAADAVVIRGQAAGRAPVLVGGDRATHRALTAAIPPAPPVEVDLEIGEGDVLDFGGGAHVLEVPGHTDGSIALHLPKYRLVFTGDALIQWAGRVMVGGFDVDPVAAAASARRVAALDVDVAALGHGAPLVGGAGAQLRRAVDQLSR